MIYGDLATNCGYTYAEIGAMTLPQYYELCRHWAKYPPLRSMVQGLAKAVLGIEWKQPDAPAALTHHVAADKPRAFTIEELKAMHPHGVMMG